MYLEKINIPLGVKHFEDGRARVFTVMEGETFTVDQETIEAALDRMREIIQELSWKCSASNGEIPFDINCDLEALHKAGEVDAVFYVQVDKPKTSFPSVIYRYRPLNEYSIRELMNSYIWLARPHTFNDPFELPDILDPDVSHQEAWLYFEYMWNHMDWFRDDYESYNSAQDAFAFVQLHKPHEVRKRVLDIAEIIDGRLRERAAMACFSRRWDIGLMWSHYANSHRGIVLGYSTEKLAEQGGGEAIQISDVDYRWHKGKERAGQFAHCPESFMESSYLSKKLLAKHPCWSYEQEIRFVKSDTDFDDNQEGVKYFIPDDALVEVILGLRFEQDKFDGIPEAVKRQAKCYKVVTDGLYAFSRVDYHGSD